jgi:hypothetical protein
LVSINNETRKAQCPRRHWGTDTPSQVDNDKQFQVRAQPSGQMVEWELVDTQELSLFIRLELADRIWSITEGFATKEKGRRVAQNLPMFYETGKPTDRRAVSLPDGEHVFVKLRRLPAFARGNANGQTTELQYMISVESDVK